MNTAAKYTEVELVTLLKDRENQAFSYLYDNYSSALYGVILRSQPYRIGEPDSIREHLCHNYQLLF